MLAYHTSIIVYSSPIVSPEGSVSVDPFNQAFDHNMNVTFTCSAKGGPDNTFQWERDGVIVSNEANFTVTQIDATDGGNYTCTVSNAAGNDSNTTTLFVNPLITLNPMDVNTTNGSMVMLMCDAEAFPEPDFQWMRVNSTIPVNAAGANTSMLVYSRYTGAK